MGVNLPVFIFKHRSLSSLNSCEKKTNEVYSGEVTSQDQVALYLALSIPLAEASLGRTLSMGVSCAFIFLSSSTPSPAVTC